MRRLVEIIRSRTREEAGFTLPELTIATVIGLLVTGAALMLVIVAQQSSPQVIERSAELQRGRVMIERIVREIRQGESVALATASGFEMLTQVNSEPCGGPPAPKVTLCLVNYSCGSTACTRTERNPDGSGVASSEQVVSGITGPAVFEYDPSTGVDPYFVAVNLVFPNAEGAESVTLRDGASLRNHFQSEPVADPEDGEEDGDG